MVTTRSPNLVDYRGLDAQSSAVSVRSGGVGGDRFCDGRLPRRFRAPAHARHDRPYSSGHARPERPMMNAPAVGRQWYRVEAFLEMMSAERGAAANTLESYRRDLADYAAFLVGHPADFVTADAEAVRGWLADLD